jgi:hypothetical protein
VSDIENAGIDDLVIVGHSLAGLTVPGVVTKIGPARVPEMILAAAFLPPDGAAFADTMPRALGWYARRTAKRNVQKGVPNTLPTAWATFAFCNWDDARVRGGPACPYRQDVCGPDNADSPAPKSSRGRSRRDNSSC